MPTPRPPFTHYDKRPDCTHLISRGDVPVHERGERAGDDHVAADELRLHDGVAGEAHVRARRGRQHHGDVHGRRPHGAADEDDPRADDRPRWHEVPPVVLMQELACSALALPAFMKSRAPPRWSY